MDAALSDRVEGGRQAMLSAVAPAKINLALHVTGQRPDGYHLLETLCVFTGFGDRIVIAPSPVDEFRVSGPYSGALGGDGPGSVAANLVTLARDALRAAFDGRCDCGPVSISLEKHLPVASGIGGGSSDAAATLKILADLWSIKAGEGELAGIALSLGADIPMCLTGMPLIARGIGDELEILDGFPMLHLLLVNPGVAVPTVEVFNGLEHKNNAPLALLPAIRSAHGIAGWLGKTRNDLQPPAMRLAPEIGEALTSLQSAGARFARMSGSGATVFGLFASRAVTLEAESAIAMQRPDWFVKAVETGGSDPDRQEAR